MGQAVRANNSIFFEDGELQHPDNIAKCGYKHCCPTHGNCPACAQSGPLGYACIHGCKKGTRASRVDFAKEGLHVPSVEKVKGAKGPQGASTSPSL